MLNNPKVITIIGDSLSQVSAEYKVFYQDTYPFKLQMLFDANEYHIRLRSRGTNQVVSQSLEENLNADILLNNSQYIILHLGIVDCAPRLFGYMEDRIIFVLSRLPVVKILVNALIKFKSKHRRFFTKYFPKTYVSHKIFKEKYALILKRTRETAKPKKLFIINIADTSEKNKYRSYNFEKNILEYNQILKELVDKNSDFCELVDFYSATKQNRELIIKDEGIHLSKAGHNFLAQLLHEKIQKEENN